MGISSNQARFLSLTARQVDLEHRVQQICQRRLRLSSELERVATDYNNSIGNRQMFTFNTSNNAIGAFNIANIEALLDSNGNNYMLVAQNAAATPAYAGLTFAGGNLVTSGANARTITPADLGLATGATQEQMVEAAIRAGVVSIATQSDEFTQTPIAVLGETENYELRDWRTMPDIADELYRGDDVAAEDKYDRIVTQINQQDKKLQLEQASTEVEYKAIVSEKEAVKKILDTNATASFKYFS
jgi:hypothetical protein